MQTEGSAARGYAVSDAGRLAYLPGLDGLRALAVAAVLLYHADVYVHGGFLGVESFFVLSGFLITALLLAEWRRYGRINLAQFWLRRARRLLPALFVVLASTLAFVAVWLPGELAALRGDALAALVYTMNWHLILSQQSYFDPSVRPSLLQHLWSLAIEEQFYLLWPLLVGLGLRFARPKRMPAIVIAAALGSIALMTLLYQPGADPSRIYYGTDTRASALLIGAALALLWQPGQAARVTRPGVLPLLVWGGPLALGGLLAAYALIGDYDPRLYRGGFTLVALLTALVIVGATHPAARWMPRALGCPPLRWLGQRSYGIYLWHWPVFMMTRPYQDVPIDGWPLLALRLTIVVALAALSYRLIEQPARDGAIGRAWRAILPARRTRAWMWRRRPSVPILSMVMIFTAACALPNSSPQPGGPVATTATAFGPSPQAAAPAAALAAHATVPPPTAEPARPTDAPPTAMPADTAAASPPAPAATAPAPTAAPAEGSFDPELATALQKVLDNLTADGTIPGAVLAVDIAGQQTWAGASGISDRRTKAAIEPDTRMRIASVSKIFTAVIVLQLAEEGKLTLDAPIDTWLPDLVPSGDRITVRNLLQHTSGLYDFLEDRSFVNRVYRDPDRVWEPRELVEYAAKFPLAFQPGERGAWDYSSTNYVILGMLVEQVTGNKLAHEMRWRIFDPLELTGTFFAPDEAVQGVQSRGYSNNIDQTAAAMSFAFATANIVSTAEDVQRFARALFDGRLLKPDTLAAMQTFVGGKGQYKMPKLAYGLGLMRNVLPVGADARGQPRPPAASTVYGHIGGFGGFRSAVWHAPEGGITIALSVNQAATDPNILATRAFDVILKHQGR